MNDTTSVRDMRTITKEEHQFALSEMLQQSQVSCFGESKREMQGSSQEMGETTS